MSTHLTIFVLNKHFVLNRIQYQKIIYLRNILYFSYWGPLMNTTRKKKIMSKAWKQSAVSLLILALLFFAAAGTSVVYALEDHDDTSASAFDDIQSTTTNEAPKEAAATYTYTDSNGQFTSVTIRATIMGKGAHLIFTKIDSSAATNHEPVPLAGAHFGIYALAPNMADEWQPMADYNGQPTIIISGLDGIVDFGFLPDGIYMLAELAASDGAVTPTAYWIIHINSGANEAIGEHIIDIFAHGPTPPALLLGENGNLLLPGLQQFSPPASGSFGVYPFIYTGALLLLCSTLLLAMTRWRLHRNRMARIQRIRHAHPCVRSKLNHRFSASKRKYGIKPTTKGVRI